MKLSDRANQSTKPKTDFGRVAMGSHPAILVQIIELGTQVQTDFQTGKPKVWEDSGKPMMQPIVLFTFEFPTSKITQDGEYKGHPRWMYKEVVLSTHEKSNIMSYVNALYPGAPENFELEELLLKPALVQVGSTASGNAKINNVMAYIDGMPQYEPFDKSKVIYFDFDMRDKSKVPALPKWVMGKIQKSKEWDKIKEIFSES